MKSIRDDAFPIDGDLAYILCQQFNGYASVTEEIEMMDEEWVLEALQNIYAPEDLAILIQDDFGRGILMGQLAYIRTIQQAEADGANG